MVPSEGSTQLRLPLLERFYGYKQNTHTFFLSRGTFEDREISFDFESGTYNRGIVEVVFGGIVGSTTAIQ